MKKLIVLFALACAMFLSVAAEASIARSLTYGESTVWRCAVRFIRVDEGFEILEKDKETGYLLFEYKEGGMTTNGSLEILKIIRNNREYVRVQMNLHGQPKYIESVLFNRLERKLKNEYGVAPAAKYVDPEGTAAKATDANNAKDAESGSTADEGATEEDLRITEDDLNQNNKD